MKRFTLALAGLSLAAAVWSTETPNFADRRWETVAVSNFGKNGLRVDKLTGDAWYLEKVNKQARWVSMPGPLSKAGLKSMSYNDNFQVKPTNSNVYLIDLNGGASWRLADSGGKPYWRRVQ